MQQLKNVMSVGDCLVEVKYGSMVFDSNLLIITSNIHQMLLGTASGEENHDPIYRRLTDSCGAYYLALVTDDNYRGLVEFIKSHIDQAHPIANTIVVERQINGQTRFSHGVAATLYLDICFTIFCTFSSYNVLTMVIIFKVFFQTFK